MHRLLWVSMALGTGERLVVPRGGNKELENTTMGLKSGISAQAGASKARAVQK